ncbi:4-diphosphocytidyl-2-C-methyl-D-erythritol kinase [Desulforhopalus sp. 52FAK]
METEKKSRIFAPAKVNLFLHVLGKREDGYHNLSTWMQKLDFGDTLELSITDNSGVELTCDDCNLPTDSDNLAVRAAESFFSKSKRLIGCGVKIHLQKMIPVAAGLGGGSSDAGAVLRGLNQLSGLEFDEKTLVGMARPLGADVPFFAIDANAVIAEGIGDEMYPVDSLMNYTFVLVNPDFSVSTKWVFENLLLTSGEINSKVPRSRKRNLDRLTVDEMHNDLEDVTSVAHPEIDSMKESLLGKGASKVLMSGSGPTVFGVFPDVRESISSDFQDIADALRKQYGNKVYISRACTGASPSGKALGFDPSIRRFESCRPSHH